MTAVTIVTADPHKTHDVPARLNRPVVDHAAEGGATGDRDRTGDVSNYQGSGWK